jgi:hypothetical protein
MAFSACGVEATIVSNVLVPEMMFENYEAILW